MDKIKLKKIETETKRIVINDNHMTVVNKNDGTQNIWLDKDRNGFYDTKIHSKNGKSTLSKLKETDNSVKQVQDKQIKESKTKPQLTHSIINNSQSKTSDGSKLSIYSNNTMEISNPDGSKNIWQDRDQNQKYETVVFEKKNGEKRVSKINESENNVKQTQLNKMIDFSSSYKIEEITPDHYKTVKNGVTYDEQFDYTRATITNSKTNETVTLNLSKNLSELPKAEKERTITLLKGCSGDLLTDLAKEKVKFTKDNCKGLSAKISMYVTNGEYKAPGGYYDINNNAISINKQAKSKKECIIHELGHALDYTGSGFFNKSSIRKNPKFRMAYHEELKAFKANGHKAGENGAYATAMPEEMFAECYTILMNGSSSDTNKDIILKYFPRTFIEVQKHIDYIRSLPEEKRH